MFNIRDLLRRHSQVITLIAALIVFLTFVVKDQIRDNLKDVASSIESARATFDNHRDLDAIIKLLDLVNVGQQDIALSGTKAASPYDDLKFKILVLRFRAFDTKFNLSSLMQSVSKISYILGKLDFAGEPLDRAVAIRGKLVDLQKGIEDLIDKDLTPWEIEPSKIHTEKDVSSQFDAIGAKLYDLISQQTAASTAMNMLEDDVLVIADKAIGSAEHRYQISTWLSLVLFTLGWGIALAAKIVGVEGVEAAG